MRRQEPPSTAATRVPCDYDYCRQQGHKTTPPWQAGYFSGDIYKYLTTMIENYFYEAAIEKWNLRAKISYKFLLLPS